MLGFYRYGSLSGVTFMEPEVCEDKEVRRSSTSDMLDLIYCIDERTGLPSGSIEQYLSDKTNDQVRSFIEKNILVDLPDSVTSVPQNLRESLLELDSDFIAKTSRNRFESRDDYERRVQTYFEDIEKDKTYKKSIGKIRSRMENLLKEYDNDN